MEDKIQDIISEFRKNLQSDGGDIELVDISGGIVKVRLIRTKVPTTFSTFLREYKTRDGITCGSCRIPTGTIISVLESILKDNVPGFIKVELVK